jgi:nucleoside-diphosphate-sugar epimerase
MKTILITGGSGFIGTNMIEFIERKGIENIINFDKKKPVKLDQEKYWIEGNILNQAHFKEILEKNNVDAVIHLAARTDTLSDNLDDYNENHEGTKCILSAIEEYNKLKRLIVASTQYVYKSEQSPYPSNSLEFQPHTIYGQSKVLMEQYVHYANLKCVWTIVRPTNIWGPWHMRYPKELWRIIDSGVYFHPVSRPVIRTYGYVKNIVHQIYQMLVEEDSLVDKKTFYVGDLSLDSYSWINEFSIQLTGKRIKRLPTFIFRYGAKTGDLLRKIGIPFPLYSKRFQNMIEDYPAPTQQTIRIFGQAENSLKNNVQETINWLNNDGKELFSYWKNKRLDK